MIKVNGSPTPSRGGTDFSFHSYVFKDGDVTNRITLLGTGNRNERPLR